MRSEQGDVILEIEINDTGTVTRVDVTQSASPDLGSAAKAAASRFIFEPAHDSEGRRIGAIVTYTQHFALPAAEHEQPKPPPLAPSPQEATPAPYSTTVVGRRDFTASSSSTVTDRDFLLRPRHTPSDILRVVPGLVTGQHAGGGKADQLFLRGFDADHGTDVAIFVDGVPVNLPSHGHGQGYADLHWLIPEAVESVEIRKGPYFPEYGDFATAGAVELRTRDRFDNSSVSVEGGQFQTFRVVGIASPDIGTTHPFLAVEAYGTDGPFQSRQGLRRYNVFGKESFSFSPTDKLSLLVTGYGAQWRASGQIPERWVGCDRPGCISRFGSIDPSEGGSTERQMMLASYQHRGGSTEFDVGAYGVRYRLSLFSDFTFQARDPRRFDEINQTDDRFYTGFNLRWRRHNEVLGRPLDLTLGASSRFDITDTELAHTQNRVRLPTCFADEETRTEPANPCRFSRTRQSDLAAWLEGDFRPTPWLRLIGALRGDLFVWDVTDLRTSEARGSGENLTGIAQASTLSPKATAVITLPWRTQLFANFGLGFHSNDGRSAISTENGKNPGQGALAQATGAEVGARTRLLEDRLELGVAAWFLHLASEQAYNSDEGSTSPSDPTNRYGLDFEARWRLTRWLFIDADLALARARYTVDRGNGQAVALAPSRVLSAGLMARHPSGLSGALRMRHIGPRAANQEGTLTAAGYTVFDLQASYRVSRFEVGVIVENLFDSAWREAQFNDRTRLASPPYNEVAPIEGIHFTPGNPRNARFFATLFF